MNNSDVSVSHISEAGSHQTLDELVGTWERITERSCEASLTSADYYQAQRVSCTTDSVLSTYDSAAAIKQNLDLLDELERELESKSRWLVGQNWTVNVPEELLEEFQRDLDGIVVTLGS
ncbi:hypothetical protein [Enteractinococcus coprophilus]|uniref:Uncharacterized protein n=1 Tax=Enteractinococcus coprophilus TaxID=1027633 RepID=A0A543AGG1_9MICC|nr:hypothetical protein [Enteractinococcus coprophilus]TQL71665.1 hypothetical protein FB556_2156 [Enteractinococcus coprophilus]